MRYEQALERSNSLDFGDLIKLAVRLFREKPLVLSHYQERFRFVLLRLNYRSPGRVLRAAQALIRHNELRKEKELLPIKGEGPPLLSLGP